jgi:GntR family transcriptional regulator, carbon starvation induced regulator
MTRLASLDQGTTQADQAYEALLAEILHCRLAPGTKINISDMAVRLGFSPGAVREALSRLSAEKWTVATAQKGYSVTPVSTAELKDLTRTRITIEQLCLRSAITLGDVEWETSIVAAYHRLHRIPMLIGNGETRVNPPWAAAHTTFHAALTAGCDSPWMLTLRTMLYAQSERYRHLSVALARENRDVDAEHRNILNACLARDGDVACALLDDHFTRTSEILLTSPLLHEDGRLGQGAARHQ